MPPGPPVVDTFTPRDVAFAAGLARRFGWTTSVRQIAALVAHDPAGCFVARIDNRPAGTVTTTRYTRSAWVGNLMVSPQTGRLGLGTWLLEHALAALETAGVATIRLDADRPGMRIYERHGFVAQFPSRRFRLGGPARRPATSAGSVSASDLAAIARFDLDAFGDDRTRLLRLLSIRAEAAFVVRRATAIVGYAFLTPTCSGVHLGPWIASDAPAAADLLAAAIRRRGKRTLTVGVPGPNRDAPALLESWGFEETCPSVRMRRGPEACGGMSERLFGLVSGACG